MHNPNLAFFAWLLKTCNNEHITDPLPHAYVSLFLREIFPNYVESTKDVHKSV